MIKKVGKRIEFEKLNRSLNWKADIVDDQRRLASEARERCDQVSVCPICSGDERQEYIEVFAYPFYQCSVCEHIYCGVRLDDKKLKNLYKSDHQSHNAQHKVYLSQKHFEERVRQIAKPKLDFVSEVLTKCSIDIIGNEVWLDVGCGAGEMLAATKADGWNALGIEIDKGLSDFCQENGYRVYNKDINEVGLDEAIGSAMVVSLINVLEHVGDPTALLESITGRMQKGAVVAFEVPKHPSLASLCARLFPSQAYRHIYPPDHLHIFTTDSMGIMMEKAGVSMLGSWAFGQDADQLFSVLEMDYLDRYGEDFSLDFSQLFPKVQEHVDKQDMSDTLLVCGVIT